jgi:hypothetical protein
MRHEWLSTPLKGKRLSKRKRSRIGLEQALVRKGEANRTDSSPPEAS